MVAVEELQQRNEPGPKQRNHDEGNHGGIAPTGCRVAVNERSQDTEFLSYGRDDGGLGTTVIPEWRVR
jgi:hypothetical protein